MRVTSGLKLSIAVAAVLMTGTALAQGNGDPGEAGPGFGEHRPPMERAMGEHGHWWNNPTIAAKLKLTDAQRKAMDDTLQQHRETLVDLRGALQKAELELEPMMKEDQPNEGNILAQIDKIAQARAELEKANARFLLAIRSKLTPEQWKQVQLDRASRPRGWTGNDGTAELAWPWSGAAGRWPGTPPPPPPGGPQSELDDEAGLVAPAACADSGCNCNSDESAAKSSNRGYRQRANTVERNTDGGKGRSSCRRFFFAHRRYPSE